MPPSIRHWCEQGDGLSMYSWFAHDGRRFGLQEIMDKYYTLSTDFVKRQGGNHGGDWTARVTVKPRVRNYILNISMESKMIFMVLNTMCVGVLF